MEIPHCQEEWFDKRVQALWVAENLTNSASGRTLAEGEGHFVVKDYDYVILIARWREVCTKESSGVSGQTKPCRQRKVSESRKVTVLAQTILNF